MGAAALSLARELEAVGREHGVAVAVAPAVADLAAVAAAVRIPVLAQHVDPAAPGPSTGFLPVATVAAVGGKGSLLNHSEHPLPPAQVATLIQTLGTAGLAAVVCAGDPETAGRLGAFRPAYLAVEPPELIGGERAVSTTRPEVVVGGVRAVHAVAPQTRVLCGAGIRSAQDVRKALELGAEGVLVASAITLAPSPRAALEDLLSGF